MWIERVNICAPQLGFPPGALVKPHHGVQDAGPGWCWDGGVGRILVGDGDPHWPLLPDDGESREGCG